tara:strand:- start:8850 stop:11360 length:2511 start_codon:yes stop_codon:yes gene_type:complete
MFLMNRLRPHKSRKAWGILLCCVAGFPALAWGTEHTPYDNSPGSFGGVGLLEMPTARFARDGELTFGVHYQDQVTRLFSVWQATPWLEAGLSYADEANGVVDRSLDIKIRLWAEADYRPALAIGLRDLLGSGRYGGEYIVASKRYYDFDFTAGVGWGLLASRNGVYNVFRLFGDDFESRDAPGAQSGKIRLGNYFAGRDMAFFGGVEYRTPVKGLTAKLEYSSIDTSRVPEFSHLEDRSAFNVGLNYKPFPWLDLAVGYEHGDRLTFRFVLSQNLHKVSPAGWAKGREPVPVRLREPGEEALAEPRVPTQTDQPPQDSDRLFVRLKGLGYHIVEVSGRGRGIRLTLQRAEQSGSHENLSALGAVLEDYEQAELIIRNAGTEDDRLAARREDGLGRMAQERFRQSAVYLREQASGNLYAAGPLKRLAEISVNRLEEEGLKPRELSLSGVVAELHHENGPYSQIPKNVGRAARVLSQEMPNHVEAFRIVPQHQGVELADITVLRKEFEKAHDYRGSPEEILSTALIRAPQAGHREMHREQIDKTDEGKEVKIHNAPPRYEWDLYPELLTHFGSDRTGKFRADLYVTARGEMNVTRGVELIGELRQRLVGDLDGLPVQDTPPVPAVRSDIARYAEEGATALKRLQMTHVHTLSSELYTRISAGYLESMFAGLDGEVLYKAYDRNWAVGMNVNWVKQRDFDQLFSFRDYDTISGHVNFYHENTKYNISTVVRAGRYLAGDWGGTLDISRRFDNGIRVGVWATFTDMSSREFGEGTFDKGIYMKIPFGMFWHKPTPRDFRLTFQTLGKNGGQRLETDMELYDLLSVGNRDRLYQDWRHILD